MNDIQPGQVPAGWYPDPQQFGAERYFDGASWTGQSRPVEPVWTDAPYGQFGEPPAPPSTRSYTTTWLLSLLLGFFGADRFYLGKTGSAIAKLLTLGGFAVWWLVDLAMTLAGKTRDAEGRVVTGEGRQPAIAWTVSATVIVASIIGAGVSSGNASEEVFEADEPRASSTPAPAEDDALEVADTEVEDSPSPVAEEPENSETVSQQQAVSAARDYLRFTAFSRSGLIDQLEFEGYSTEDATYAVDHVGADWFEQAALSAEQYLQFSAFSKSGLIDQLLFEGFTEEEAAYGVEQVYDGQGGQAAASAQSYLDVMAFSRDGLIDQLEFEGYSNAEATAAVDSLDVDWNEQAAAKAREYLEYSSFSRSALIDQLIFEGFTAAQAEHGVNSVGL